MPFQQTSGNSTQDAYGGGVAVEPVYIESIFSTWLYTGTGAAQTITNGIDLSTKGGLVWTKIRSQAYYHYLFDTVRGAGYSLNANDPYQQTYSSNDLTGFTSTGFTLGTDGGWHTNKSGETYVSWTFRKQPKFFDIVTYTGNGSTNQTISHSLGSTPGCVIIKSTTEVKNWAVWHTTIPFEIGKLNLTDAWTTFNYFITSSGISSTTFQVGGGNNSTANNLTNVSGETYVAYLFAHNAGGFGLTGTDNVISCGSYTGTGANGNEITLGYEPQWLLFKRTNAVDPWLLFDTMRGMSNTGGKVLYPYDSAAEDNVSTGWVVPTATGFRLNNTQSSLNGSGSSYIYIAIRRGPMKVPTDATKVFSPLALSNSTGTANTTGFPVALQIQKDRAIGLSAQVVDRLRGVSSTSTAGFPRLYTAQALAENNSGIGINFNNTGFSTGSGWSGQSMVYWNFQRAPGFFDEVCYTGTGSATTFNHNLTVAPEILIVKSRPSASYPWPTLVTAIGGNGFLFLDTTSTTNTASTYFNNTYPTASVFSVGSHVYTNELDTTYVAYLFATCPGVSKVGGYTGNGTTQTINCGFTGGARFVLIKCTNVVGDWYTYDTARGMTTLTDPYLLLNSGAVETATLGSVTTVSTGFALNSTILADINASGNTYIFLAIA